MAAKKKKPTQGALFEETPEHEWIVITTEAGVHELRHTSTGKLAHDKATNPSGLARLRSLADAHNGLKLMPRAKVECAADIGGSVEAALRAQTKTADRNEAKRKTWHSKFRVLFLNSDLMVPTPDEDVIESWRRGGLPVAQAFAAFAEHIKAPNA